MTPRRLAMLAILLLGPFAAAPALAQHDHHVSPPARQSSAPTPMPMPVPAPAAACSPEHAAMGHCTPPAPPAPTKPAANPTCPPEHAAMGHCTPKPAAPPPPVADPACPPEHAAMGHCTPRVAGAAPPVAPPPPAALTGPRHAADAVWGADVMAAVRARRLIAEHGGFSGHRILIDRIEARLAGAEPGYAWDAEGWFGGDYDRLWIKTEGEGGVPGRLECVETQALYSRAIGPWWNLQAGVRYDARPGADRAHLALGVQGLAPYWFEVDAAAFLSARGDLTARVEAEYDQRLSNRLILQPRVAFDLSAQDVPDQAIGAGVSRIEAGLRLRYEVAREFAPYVGIGWERAVGRTASLVRRRGDGAGGAALLLGLRAWF